MPEFDRLNGDSGWIDLEFMERERTPEEVVEMGIQLHLAVLSISNTKQHLEWLGVQRSRTAIHNWVQKADLQPKGTRTSNYVALDETVIQLGTERYWLYAAVDPKTNEFLHVRLFPTANSGLTHVFLRELREKHDIDDATFLIDDADHLQAALSRLGLRFHIRRHGNRNSVERVFREVKRRTSSFSNTFSNVEPTTAESWLEAFAVWWNRCQS
ncbi:IS6 family transposase [Halapricum hydrolyticum]|uniref:IS6 family transposase n=1 Tax=Halapricum hydrolyticum TaxID=2979991 RepID=A0AAE3ICW0_9EURY|nr:IS6 family transposase [Halapricum hydrolyticum]MCU4717759.1 IS6 family transposase [Halapricum hydrolyticum]MCU4726923.1 IS6 family transposase [Halapricum hydrolyticum]